MNYKIKNNLFEFVNKSDLNAVIEQLENLNRLSKLSLLPPSTGVIM